MSPDIILSVDAMGGDHAPQSIVEGIALCTQNYRTGLKFLLHGDASVLDPLVQQHASLQNCVEICHTTHKVSMGDKPVETLKKARGSSMWNALEAVREGKAHATVSAGNTGALMVLGKVVLQMKRGVHRPAITASWPTIKNYAVVLDIGANTTASPQQLVEFAIMGEAFYRAIYGKEKPSVGLLNVGSEEAKGHETIRKADTLIKQADLNLNYQGFVEGDDISKGTTDVVVTDGFTGNIALKTAEGTARLAGAFLRRALQSSWRAKLGAFLALDALKVLKNKDRPPCCQWWCFSWS